MSCNKPMRRRISRLLAALLVFLTAQAVFAAEAAPEMRMLDFENGTRMGVTARNEDDTSILTVTDEEAHGGSRSLLVTGRSDAWHGPSVNVEFYVDPGVSYTVSVWVLPKTPGSSDFRLSTQIGEGDGASYQNIDRQTVSNGWTELKGTAVYFETDYITIYVENDDPQAEFYIDDLSFRPTLTGGIRASIELPSLYEIYAGHFPVGTAISRLDLIGLRLDLIKRHFNLLTMGNDMKPAYLGQGGKDRFAYSRADELLELMLEEGFPVHGHTLVWHQQSALWLNMDENGNALTRAEAKENLELFVTTVAEHYAGRVISWDVVNEALTNNGTSGNWEASLRTDAPWFMAYENGADKSAGESGADYIYDAFVFARLADPGSILYYNDFNEEIPTKREAMALMAEMLNRKWEDDARNTEPGRKLVEGLGMQAHYNVSNLNPKTVEDTVKRFIEAGVEVGVTELDIPGGNGLSFTPLSEDGIKKQAELYAQLFLIFKEHSAHISRVTIWGIDDPTSWRREGQPLLFDDTGEAKPAFYAVMDPEGYLAGEYDALFDKSAVTPPPPAAASPAAESTPPPSPQDSGNDDGGEEPEEAGSNMVIIIVIGSAAIAAGIIAFLAKKRK